MPTPGSPRRYIITDDFEIGLVSSGLLPDLVGIPLIIQDKTFVSGQHSSHQIPPGKWGKRATCGTPMFMSLIAGHFPIVQLTTKAGWDYGPCDGQPPAVLPDELRSYHTLPNPSVVPEFFADTTMVNGAPYPVVSVPPKRVRFRMLNGSQARFYHLNLYPEDPSIPERRIPLGKPGPIMYQVGTEGGFLPASGDARQYDPYPVGSRIPVT